MAFSRTQIGLAGKNYYGLTSFSAITGAGLYNKENSSIGFGFSLENGGLISNNLKLGFAHKLHPNFALGISLNYTQLKTQDQYYTPTNTLSFSIGSYYQVNSQLNLGFNINNPLQAKLNNNLQEMLPYSVGIGLDYLLNESTTLYGQLTQDEHYPINLSGGAELRYRDWQIRGGFGLNSSLGIGVGYTKSKFRVNVATNYHNVLGFSPSLDLKFFS